MVSGHRTHGPGHLNLHNANRRDHRAGLCIVNCKSDDLNSRVSEGEGRRWGFQGR